MTSKTEASIQLDNQISTLAKRIADLEQQRSRAALEGDGYRACQLVDAIRRDTLTWQGLVQARALRSPQVTASALTASTSTAPIAEDAMVEKFRVRVDGQDAAPVGTSNAEAAA
jgi:hypothetical protein